MLFVIRLKFFVWVRAIWEMIAATVRLPWVAPTVLVGPRHLEGDRSYCAPPLGSAHFYLFLKLVVFLMFNGHLPGSWTNYGFRE